MKLDFIYFFLNEVSHVVLNQTLISHAAAEGFIAAAQST